MARILYCHPAQTNYSYHLFTDLDFWESRRLLMGLATIRRNFGKHVCGDSFPTQIVAEFLDRRSMFTIEKRLKKAIPSPARHVIVRSMILDGYFQFDPYRYYPAHWTKDTAMRFTYSRLPLQQGALCTPYKTVQLSWADGLIRVEQVQRKEKYDPVIRDFHDARERLRAPSCF